MREVFVSVIAITCAICFAISLALLSAPVRRSEEIRLATPSFRQMVPRAERVEFVELLKKDIEARKWRASVSLEGPQQDRLVITTRNGRVFDRLVAWLRSTASKMEALGFVHAEINVQ